MREEKLLLAILRDYHRKYTVLFLQVDVLQIIYTYSEKYFKKYVFAENNLFPRIKELLAHD